MITLTPRDWKDNLRSRLVEEYGPSILISYVCKTKLGFTVRNHTAWIDNKNFKVDYTKWEQIKEDIKHGFADDLLLMTPPSKGHSKLCVCLDFYDDAMETWFRLKYL
jgi:hypothetical protein